MDPVDIERAMVAANDLARDIAKLVSEATPSTPLHDDLSSALTRVSRAGQRLERAALQLHITIKDQEIVRDTAARNELQTILSGKPQT